MAHGGEALEQSDHVLDLTHYNSIMISAIKAVWLGGRDAGIYVGRSRDWVEIRALAWQDEWIRGRIRYQLDVDSGDRRYFVEDLDLLQEPPRKHKAFPGRLAANR